MKILFIDALKTYKPYDPKVLQTEPLAGTQSSLVRIAEGLAALGFHVRVMQEGRQKDYCTQGALYTNAQGVKEFTPTHVIALHTFPELLYHIREKFSNAKLFLWEHDLILPESKEQWHKTFQIMAETKTAAIVVSNWHRKNFETMMRLVNFEKNIRLHRIYNPIDDTLEPDETPIDENKLLFFSSPHKGLRNTLEIFKGFEEITELKNTKLYIANPGYVKSQSIEYKNVINLGSLSYPAVIKHVRSAWAVLHLNGEYPETFGLVHAEANAVGTPFLSGDLGATSEIIDHPEELVDVTSSWAVEHRLISWKRFGRPKVVGNDQFRLKTVIKEWADLLTGMAK